MFTMTSFKLKQPMFKDFEITYVQRLKTAYVQRLKTAYVQRLKIAYVQRL